MRKTALLAPLTVAILLAAASSGFAADPVHVLSRGELDSLLAQPSKLVVLDVRRPDELTSIGGFPAYFSIQLADLEKNLDFIPNDRTIVTVSNHAKRAQRAAELLARRGFKVAGAVGVQDYEREGGKLTKVTKPAAPASKS